MVYVRGNQLQSGCSTGAAGIASWSSSTRATTPAKSVWGPDAPVTIDGNTLYVTVPPSQAMLVKMD
jgi:hypothetical protein